MSAETRVPPSVLRDAEIPNETRRSWIVGERGKRLLDGDRVERIHEADVRNFLQQTRASADR
jgi:hypothetical protein